MAEGVELGTGYISILPETTGIARYLKGELGKALRKAGIEAGDDFGKGIPKGYKAPRLKAPTIPKPEIPTPDAPEMPDVPELDVPPVTFRVDDRAFDSTFGSLAKLRGNLSDVSRLDISDPVKRLGRDIATSEAFRQIPKLEAELAGLATKAKIDGRIDVDGAQRLKDITDELDKIERKAKSFTVDVKGDIDLDVDSESAAAGDSAGGAFLGGFAGGLSGAKAGAVAAVAAVVGAALAGVAGGISREASLNVFQASLQLDEAEAARLGSLAGEVWASNYGESRDDVLAVLRTVALDEGLEASNAVLEDLVKTAFNIETAFKMPAAEVATFVGIMDQLSELDSRQIQDLLVGSFSNLPAESIGDFNDALLEYLPFMRDAGFTTAEAFTLFERAGVRGQYALDKTGDAVKEFGIRATDGSKATKEAFADIGLDAEQMAADLLSPDREVRRGAFDKTIEALLGVEDASERAELAVALIGPPVEDLSVVQLPEFLASLQDVPPSLAAVEDASGNLDTELWEGLGPALGEARRRIITDFQGAIDGNFGPSIDRAAEWAEGLASTIGEEGLSGGFSYLGSSIGEQFPILGEFSAWFEEHINPALDGLAALLDEKVVPRLGDAYDRFERDLLPVLEDLAGWLEEHILPLFTDMAETLADDIVPAAELTFDALDILATASFDRLIDWLDRIERGIDAVKTAAEFAKDAVNAIPGASSVLGLAGVGGRSSDGGGGSDWHTGGTIPGPVGTEVPGVLLAGEEVLSIRDARIYRAALEVGGNGLPSGHGVNIEVVNVMERGLVDELVEIQAQFGAMV